MVRLNVNEPNTKHDLAYDVYINFDTADPQHVSSITRCINVDGTTLHEFSARPAPVDAADRSRPV